MFDWIVKLFRPHSSTQESVITHSSSRVSHVSKVSSWPPGRLQTLQDKVKQAVSCSKLDAVFDPLSQGYKLLKLTECCIFHNACVMYTVI